MIARVPLLFCLLASLASVDASALLRKSEPSVRTAGRAHRRSENFIRDLRLAYSGIRTRRSDPSSGSQTPFCVNLATNDSSLAKGSNSNGGDGARPAASVSTTASGRVRPSATSSRAPAASSSAAASSPWKLKQSYEGNSFFGGWAFFTDTDPTGGTVDFINGAAAQTANLTGINSAGNAYMAVDTTPVVSGARKSVRMTTDFSYTQGIVVLDAAHMPTGCGTWPAFWSNGPNWPSGGEIDIVEGVNTYTNDQVTLHTSPGCALPSTNADTLGISGTLVSTQDCAAADTQNAGCGVRSEETNSYGAGFNAMGGGVYAMQWVDSGITVHFFARNSIPADITAGTPNPDAWGTPIASFPSTSCNTTEFFHDHSLILDTTLCGDWAGTNWESTGVPGQETSCAAMTNTATCADYVLNNGGAFSEAYWEVKSVKIYQTN